MKKAYDKIDWQDVAMAATQGIKVKSKLTDEQVNCVYSLYKNFQNEEAGIIKKTLSSGIDCLLSDIVTYGYDNVKKRKLFSELGKALQDQRKYDIVIDYLSKIITKERRDEFVKKILEKAIQESYKN